jgi:hypothetical protein
MSENTPYNPPPDVTSQPEPGGNRSSRSPGTGERAILILLGVIFLLQNTGIFTLANWWALFILIPALGAFGNAWSQYREAGRFDSQARGSLIGGLLLSIVAGTFLFGLDWGRVWPVFLIVVAYLCC